MQTNKGHLWLSRWKLLLPTAVALVVLADARSAAQTNIVFRENFEGSFPQAGAWLVGDQNPAGPPAFWDVVNLFTFGSPPPRGGGWVGYCAGAGYVGDDFQPFYQSSMTAFMSTRLDLRDHGSAELRFWHTVPSIEEGFDQCTVFINGQAIYTSSEAFGWTQTTLDLTAYAGTQIELAFVFFSDEIFEGEGWYLDDIEVAAGGVRTPRVVRGPYLQSGTASNIVVRWRTDLPSDGRVQFGLQSSALNWQVPDASLTKEHIITLTNLAPNTKYYYAIGTSGENLAGDDSHYFVTAPLGPKPTRIWAIGDSGTASAGVDTWRGVRDAYVAHTGGRETDVWLMLGDNAYHYGTDAQFQVAVFEAYAELLRKWTLWSTIGNHETYAPLIGEPIAYFDNFTFPTAGEAGGEPSGSENYYSFDHGGVHFVCVDSELAANFPGSPMLLWLEADLAANTNLWTIAFFHSPPYNFGTHNSDNPADTSGHLVQMRENVVPILESYGVDVVLCGHSHSYERSFLLNGHYGYSASLTPAMIKDAGDGRTDGGGAYRKRPSGPEAQGAVYVVAGSSGWVTGDTFIPQYLHPAMFIKLKELGSMVIDVDGNRLDAKFLRETGAIDDYFTIIKEAQAEDVLRIAMFRVQNDVVTARWNSVNGRTYRVEKTSNLTNPDWHPASPEIEADGPMTTWSGAAAPGANESYYRVVFLY
jgi:hypothetical protein